MRRRVLVMIGAAGLFLALLGSAPATLLDARLDRSSAGRWRLAEAQGTLWSGQGRLELRDAAGRSSLAKPLSWRLLPATLWRAGLAYELHFSDEAGSFQVLVSPSGIASSDIRLGLPASALSALAPGVEALGLGGDLRIQLRQLSLGHGSIRGELQGQWLAAASALSPLSPLGDYEVRAVADMAGIRITLATLRGPLHVTGVGAWAHGGQPRFDAAAQVEPALRPGLAPFLRLVAVEQADGSFARAYVR